MDTRDAEHRIHSDLGLKRLNPVWAKIEIFGGLAAACSAMLWGNVLTRVDPLPLGQLAACVGLMVAGLYLALAGHRSHLYQSNNKLAAWLHMQQRVEDP